ncbi:hypothetical protein ACVINZ_003078 [Mesorhizobium jarvisii]
MNRSLPAREELFLDHVFHAARHQRALRLFAAFLAQPRHGPVKVMERQTLGALDTIIGHPVRAVAVRARHEQPMQRANEHRPFHRKAELAPFQHLFQHIANPEPLPQPPEQQRTANAARGNPPRVNVGQDEAAFAMARNRGRQSVKFAAGNQRILAAQCLYRALANGFAVADTFHEVEIAMAARDSLNDKHASVVSK